MLLTACPAREVGKCQASLQQSLDNKHSKQIDARACLYIPRTPRAGDAPTPLLQTVSLLRAANTCATAVQDSREKGRHGFYAAAEQRHIALVHSWELAATNKQAAAD
jgi:hypothetical protein